MMELADFAMYVAVFSAVGPMPLAVTTNLNINFLRKPAPADLLADAKLLLAQAQNDAKSAEADLAAAMGLPDQSGFVLEEEPLAAPRSKRPTVRRPRTTVAIRLR